MIDQNQTAEKPKTLSSALVPRVFLLRWNNRKLKYNREAWHECWGCQFPNGLVLLDFGRSYSDLGELMTTVEDLGECKLYWLDEETSSETF